MNRYFSWVRLFLYICKLQSTLSIALYVWNGLCLTPLSSTQSQWHRQHVTCPASARGLIRPSSCQRKRLDQVSDALLKGVRLTRLDGARGIRQCISMQVTPLRKRQMLAAAGSDHSPRSRLCIDWTRDDIFKVYQFTCLGTMSPNTVSKSEFGSLWVFWYPIENTPC